MNTTTNTRGVSEAMDRLREIAHRDEAKAVTVRADDLRAVLAALSAQQGQGQEEAVADECRHNWVDYVQAEYKPRHRVFELGESNIERYVRIGLTCTICGKEKAAPPAQPERVPEGVLGYFSRDDAEKLLKRKGEERISFSHIEVWNRQSEFYPVALLATPAPAEEGDGKDDASRYAFVREAFDGMTTSQSERFLELLGIEGDVFKPLDDAIDIVTGAAR